MQYSDIAFLTLPVVFGMGLPIIVNLISKRKNLPCGKRPAIQPPGWVFATVWSIIYVLLGICGYYGWVESQRDISNIAIIMFILLLVFLNAWWFIFSNICASFASFCAIIALFIYTIITILVFFAKKLNKSGWFTIPLALWLIFASTLSYLSI